MRPDGSADSPAAPQIVCPTCGYDQRGISSERCPECGTRIDRESLAVSRIPWEHRRMMGRVRAYRRTLWRVMADAKAIGSEAARPVSYDAAQRFRWVTVILVFLAIALATTLSLAVQSASDREQAIKEFAGEFPVPTELRPWMMPLAFAGFFLALVVATGVPSYFFHPRALPVEQQNRAIALSYYGSAMLAWIALPVVLLWAGLVLYPLLDEITQRNLLSASVAAFLSMEIAIILFTLAWWWKLIVLLRVTTRCGLGRAVLLGLTMVACVPLGVAIVFALPSVVGYVMVLLR